MNTFHIGDKVQHDFSKDIGHIRIIDNNRIDYNYFIIWENNPNRNDWYTGDVLVLIQRTGLARSVINTKAAKVAIVGENPSQELYEAHGEEWVDAENIKIRMILYEDNKPEGTVVIRTLRELMSEDDGGFYGVDQAQCDAAEKVYGDHMRYDEFRVESMQIKKQL